MQGRWIVKGTRIRINGNEAAGASIQPARTVVLEPAYRVVWLTGIRIRLSVGSCVLQKFPEGGVRVRVGDNTGLIAERPNRTDAVRVIPAGLTGAGPSDDADEIVHAP